MNIFKKFFGTSKKNEMAQDECQQDLSDNKLEVEEKLSDKQKEYITSFPQLFYPLMTRQFFCDFHEKSEDFCVS